MIFKNYQRLSILIAFTLLFYFGFDSIEAQTNSALNTFSDPDTGISFQYPSDWHVASKEYLDTLFGMSNSEDSLSDVNTNNIFKPIVMVIPESMSGSMLGISYEILPFPASVEEYYEKTKQTTLLMDPTASVGEPIPISIGSWNGLKFNASNPDFDLTQTQMVFVKDSKGYIVAFQTIPTGQIKESQDLTSIINSLKFDNS